MNHKPKDHRHVHTEICFSVTVRLLEDDTVNEIDVPEDATGKWLFDEVCRRQDVMEEREYFGLRYLEHELLSSPTKQWIDLTRSVLVQLKNTHPRTVSFRIKHYPADPFADLKLAKTHYLLYRQLRRDLASGRLVAAQDEMVRLAALIVQVELGDSSVQDLPQVSTKLDVERTYLSDFQVLHHQTKRMEALVLEEHKKLEGLLPSEAANELIQLASSLETYGIDPIRVKTKAYGSRPLHIGLTHRGVAEFLSNRCQKIYLWTNISWMTCDGKHFILAYAKQTFGKKKKDVEMVSFKCETKAVARALWEWATDRQLFLTLEKSTAVKPVKSKRGLFSRKHTFTFSGRCRREVLARPTLAATLPSDISKSHLEDQVDHFCGEKIESAGAYSVSMMALTHTDVAQPGCAMQTIGEVECNEGIASLGSASRPTTDQSPTLKMKSLPGMTRGQASVLSDISSNTPNNIASSSTNRHRFEDVPPVPRIVPPEFLAPLFEELPRRRYTSDAKIRQRKLVRTQKRNLSGEERNADIFDSEEDEAMAIAELDAVTEAADRDWADGTAALYQQNDMKTSDSGSFFSRLFSTPSKTQATLKPDDLNSEHPVRSRTSSSVYHSAISETSNEPVETGDSISTSGWGILATSAGIVTGVSLVGLALILETEVRSPLMIAFREHPWILDFDTRFYRPIRTALFGFWRR